MRAAARTPELDVKGDFSLPARANLALSVTCEGSAAIGDGARVDGDVVATRVVRVGAAARVVGALRAGGGVEWDPGASAGSLETDGPLKLGEHVLAHAVEARRGVGPPGVSP